LAGVVAGDGSNLKDVVKLEKEAGADQSNVKEVEGRSEL
jgi:hypothetical protein